MAKPGLSRSAGLSDSARSQKKMLAARPPARSLRTVALMLPCSWRLASILSKSNANLPTPPRWWSRSARGVRRVSRVAVTKQRGVDADDARHRCHGAGRDTVLVCPRSPLPAYGTKVHAAGLTALCKRPKSIPQVPKRLAEA